MKEVNDCEHGKGVCYEYHIDHDCFSREHDPDEWCPDCFNIKKVK